jgi:hypothetical protein
MILATLLSFMQCAFGQDDIIMTNGVMVGNIGDEVRYFYDPGGPATDQESGFFGQNLRDTMTLRTSVAHTVMYILFDSFGMGPGDTLFIFDGPDCNSPLIGVYNLVRSPGEIQGTDKSMTFVFHSDDQDIAGLQDGWVARVSAFDTIPTIIRFGKDNLDYSSLTCYAEFYDSGGENGNILQNNENPYEARYVEFTSPVGTHVKCEFTQFSVNGILKIYDGQFYDPNKRLIGQFCTSTLDATTNNMPPTFFSTGGTLSFVYKGAAGDQNKAGWRAVITCVPELFENEDNNPFVHIQTIPLGYYSDVEDPSVILLDSVHPTVVLQARVSAPGHYTNDYKVEQIPYDESAMLFSYNVGAPIPWPASVTNPDDKWAAPVELPFIFSFFGKPYTTICPSANAIISFDYHEPWSNCAWSTEIPPISPPYNSTNPPYNYVNSAYLVYEDIDPEPTHCSLNDAIRYGVYEAPGCGDCRAFVFNNKDMGLFSCCSSGSQYYNTYQMVLYEGTNIIDVYIRHRACCTNWNSGHGVIGLQNKTSSQILTVPGRDFNSNWTTQNEAWRFTPITPLDEQGEFSWYINDTNSVPFSHDKVILVSNPNTDVTQYISVYRYTDASDSRHILMDTTIVLCPHTDDPTDVAAREADFIVYPNPTRNVVYVEMRNTLEKPSSIEVMDFNGKLLFTVPAYEITKVDLSRLPAGIYFLNVHDRQNKMVKVVKQ